MAARNAQTYLEQYVATRHLVHFCNFCDILQPLAQHSLRPLLSVSTGDGIRWSSGLHGGPIAMTGCQRRVSPQILRDGTRAHRHRERLHHAGEGIPAEAARDVQKGCLPEIMSNMRGYPARRNLRRVSDDIPAQLFLPESR